jgi:hypothetical protein
MNAPLITENKFSTEAPTFSQLKATAIIREVAALALSLL